MSEQAQSKQMSSKEMEEFLVRALGEEARYEIHAALYWEGMDYDIDEMAEATPVIEQSLADGIISIADVRRAAIATWWVPALMIRGGLSCGASVTAKCCVRYLQKQGINIELQGV